MLILAWSPLTVAPIASTPSNSGPGVTIRLAPGPVTIPDIGIDCGLSPAVSVTINVAVRVPVAEAEGLNAT